MAPREKRRMWLRLEERLRLCVSERKDNILVHNLNVFPLFYL